MSAWCHTDTHIYFMYDSQMYLNVLYLNDRTEQFEINNMIIMTEIFDMWLSKKFLTSLLESMKGI